MAITSLAFDFFKQLLETKKHRPVKMVSTGYPDALVSAETLVSLYGDEIIKDLPYREDSQKVLKWHHFDKILPGVYETSALLNRIGIELTVVDITEARGGEIISDLNNPLNPELVGEFDIVLDPGTMEHCFNIGQVITNFLAMAKIGGHIIHLNPLFVLNHGFYNFSPTFYQDFYIDNGHKLASKIFGFTTKGLDYTAFELPPFTRPSGVPEHSWVCAIAQKTNNTLPKWPVQTKYKRSPTLGG